MAVDHLDRAREAVEAAIVERAQAHALIAIAERLDRTVAALENISQWCDANWHLEWPNTRKNG